MATNLTNDPVPFTSRAAGDQNNWDQPLDAWVTAISADVATVASVADTAVTAAATAQSAATAAAANTVVASRIADGSLSLTKLATAVAPKTETDAIKATADAALAAAGGATPVRVATATTTATLGDRGGIIHMRNASAATVALPLTGAISPTFPATGATIVGVDRLNADVSFTKTATGTTLQKFIAPYGVQAMLVGSTMTAEYCRPPDATRPTTGLRALIVGDQFSALADGTAITTVVPDASGSVSLPGLTPSGTQQPTVHRNAAKGHTGIRFNGTTNVIPLSGAAWLDLMRNRPNAMIFAVVLVPGTAPTGNRTIVSFLSANTTTPGARAQIKWRDTGTNAAMVLGRRLDSETASTAANGAAAAAPDLSVIGGRFLWSTAGTIALRNGVNVGTSAAFGTLGNTPDTASTAAAIGANGSGTTEFFQGTILEVAIYDDSASVATAYQAYAEQQYGEEWLISADGPAA